MATINADAPKRTIVNAIDARLVSEDGSKVGVQSPLPVNTESVHASDINVQYSDNGGFSGNISDYFISLKSVSVDTSATDPKSIKLWFNRTVQTSTIGLGCDDLTKSFSNVQIKFLGSGEEVKFVWDGTNDSTKRNSYLIELPPIVINGVIIEFHTADAIGLSNIYIPKLNDTRAQIAAIKDDDTVASLTAEDDGSLRVSVSNNLEVSRGGQSYRKTYDIVNDMLLQEILQELQKMNEQLSLITDEEL